MVLEGLKMKTKRFLVKEKKIKERWKDYFDRLFNGGYIERLDNLMVPYNDLNCDLMRRIREYEIMRALRKMKTRKATSPDCIPIEV